MEKLAKPIAAYPRLAALVFGVLAACGFPPLGLWPIGLAGVAGLVWLVGASEGWRQAAWRGWLFGFAYFTVTNNWIATAFTFQEEMPVALGWAAVPLLSLYLALYPALATALGKALGRKGAPLVFALAAAWVLAEWLRSWVFTGYAWGPLSLMLLGSFERPGAALMLPWLGTYALSGLTVALGGGILLLALARKWIALGALAFLLALAMHLPKPATPEGTLALTLVQPNLKQEEIDDPRKFEEQFLTISALSRPARDVERRLVLWPESGVPDYLEDGYPQRYYAKMTAAGDPAFARRRIGHVIGEGSLLLTGIVHLEIGEVEGRARAVGAYNSITAIGSDGTFKGTYAKAHLVPYGEYLPMRGLLEPLGLTRLVAGSIDFIPGPGPRTLDLGDYGRAGMQICYEIVFSGETVDRADRPDFIFNPSNDGWFGSWGPPQHLAQARMRAIEEGLPVLRSTTTGISAVIDAHGVVRSHIGRGLAERIESHVPPALAPTWFARLGHWLTALWGALFLLLWAVAARLRNR